MASGTTKRVMVWGGLAVLAGGLIVACPPLKPPPFEAFSYARRLPPRVFVSHHPLLPAPGASIKLRVAPDLAANAAIARAFASLDQGAGPVEHECPASSSGGFECSFTLDAGTASAAYGARIELVDGTRLSTRTRYRFSVGDLSAAADLIAVRVPEAPVARLADRYRVNLALMREMSSNYSTATFAADAESTVYDGILADPAYRWRDDQFGFHLFTRSGVTSSYYSGVDTRCGQNPFPNETALSSSLAKVDVLGVLHRLTTSLNSAEGRASGGGAGAGFRDCAGLTVRPVSGSSGLVLGSFSAVMGLPESASVATHEFGHAAFAHGDEYHEPQSSRNVPPAAPQPPSDACCCRVPAGGGGGVIPLPAPGTSPTSGTGGPGTTGPVVVGPIGGGPGGGLPGVDTVRCMGPGGTITTQPNGFGSTLPTCGSSNTGFASTCGASPQGGCPSLIGQCVDARMWLGSSPPAGSDTARPNVYPTQAACDAARTAAAGHPAVEDPAHSLGTCRQLCGSGAGPVCPCGLGEAWITDIDPRLTAGARDDLMAAPAQRGLGGTCAWCVDTSLCVRWHRALGDSAEIAWATCNAPPRSATDAEKVLQAFVDVINQLIEWFSRLFTF